MKNITKLLIAIIGIITFSCSTNDVQDRPAIAGKDAPVLTAPTDGAGPYVLSLATYSQQAERFVWSSANYAGSVQVTYTLQIDKQSGDFSAPQVIGGAVSANQASVTQQALNTACIALGAVPFQTGVFLVRVMSTVGGGSPMYSNVVSISVTTYGTVKLYLPGSYQADSGYGSNWTQSSAARLLSSDTNANDFEGYMYVNSAQLPTSNGMKFSTKTDWTGTNYGDDGSGSYNTLSPTGDNIGLTPGYYLVKANTTPGTMSYSLTPTTWAIIGNATAGGWNTDTPMTYNLTTKKWSVIATLTTKAAPNDGLKFRANSSWTLNLGDTGADGIMEYGGTNISTTAGTYLIELDLSNPRNYTYKMTLQ